MVFPFLYYGKAQRTPRRDIERRKIRPLHRDPAAEKLLCLLRRIAAQNALALQFRGDVQKNGKVVVRRKVGVHGVCPLGHNELSRRGLHGALQLHGSAVEPPVKNLFAAPEREQHLGKEALPIHISSGLGKPRRCALLGAKEEVVHVEYGAAVPPGEDLTERRLAACAPALDSETHGQVSGQPPVKLGKECLIRRRIIICQGVSSFCVLRRRGFGAVRPKLMASRAFISSSGALPSSAAVSQCSLFI